ncbi:MAG: hypothetical protein ABIA74_05365 [bacterium]
MKKILKIFLLVALISTQINLNAMFQNPKDMIFSEESERIRTDIINFFKQILNPKNYNPNKLTPILKKASPWLVFAALLAVAYSYGQEEADEAFCWDISEMITNYCSDTKGFNDIYNCVYGLLLDELKEKKIKCTYVRCMQMLQREELWLLSREFRQAIKQCILDYLFREKYRYN